MTKNKSVKPRSGGTRGAVNQRTQGGAPKSKVMLPKPSKTPRDLGPASGRRK